jgi:hypothetical protein
MGGSMKPKAGLDLSACGVASGPTPGLPTA